MLAPKMATSGISRDCAAIKSAFVMRDILEISVRVCTDAMALIVVPTAIVLMECVIVMDGTAETDVKR